MPSAKAKYVLVAEDRTGSAFASVRQKFGNVARTATRVGAGIGLAAGAGFAKMAKDAIDAADEVGKLSRTIGVSTENLSQMKGVLELTGGSFDQYTNSLRKMQRNIVNFNDGSKDIVDAFDAIGVAAEDLKGLLPEDQFDVITKALAGMTDATERSARAQEIFGRSSQTVLRLVDAGADEVARLREEQVKLGNTMSTKTTDSAERFNDAISRMGQALQGAVLGTVTENIDDMATSMEKIVGLVPSIISGLAAVAGFTTGVGNVIGGGVAAAEQFLRGNFSEAGTIAGQVASDVFGGDASEVVNEQQTTNDLLRGIATNGVAARAG